MPQGDDILKRHDELRDLRRPIEPQWRALAKLFTPDEQEFEASTSQETDFSDLFDATHLYAADDFAGGIFGQLTNPANRWFEYGLDDQDLEKWPPVKENLFARANVTYASLSPAVSNFYADAPAWFANVGVFGIGPFSQEERLGERRIIDRALPIGQIFIDVDSDGEISEVHREFPLRGRQVKATWPGYVGHCDDTRSYVIVQAIFQNPDFREGALGSRGMRYRSVHVSPDLKEFYIERGFHEMPIHFPQWKRRAGKTYPTGPGWKARPDVASLQEMERAHLVAAQFAAEPPLMVNDDDVLTAADIVPNALLHGTINDKGTPLAQYLVRQQNMNLSEKQSETRRSQIRTAFYYGIMQLINRPQMTATEFLGFQEENLKLMAPNLVRIQTGGLSPFLARRHNILDRAGQMAPAPPELKNRRLVMRYVSPLAKAMALAEGRAVLQVQQAIEQMAITDPNVRDKFNADIAADKVGESFSAIPGLIRDDKTVASIRQSRAQQQQQAQQLQMQGQTAEIAATVAHAEQASTLAKRRAA